MTGQQKYGTQLLGPVACDGSCQGIAAEGFEINAFAVNWDKQKVTCPLGKESVLFRRVKNARGRMLVEAGSSVLSFLSPIVKIVNRVPSALVA